MINRSITVAWKLGFPRIVSAPFLAIACYYLIAGCRMHSRFTDQVLLCKSSTDEYNMKVCELGMNLSSQRFCSMNAVIVSGHTCLGSDKEVFKISFTRAFRYKIT